MKVLILSILYLVLMKLVDRMHSFSSLHSINYKFSLTLRIKYKEENDMETQICVKVGPPENANIVFGVIK